MNSRCTPPTQVMDNNAQQKSTSSGEQRCGARRASIAPHSFIPTTSASTYAAAECAIPLSVSASCHIGKCCSCAIQGRTRISRPEQVSPARCGQTGRPRQRTGQPGCAPPSSSSCPDSIASRLFSDTVGFRIHVHCRACVQTPGQCFSQSSPFICPARLLDFDSVGRCRPAPAGRWCCPVDEGACRTAFPLQM